MEGEHETYMPRVDPPEPWRQFAFPVDLRPVRPTLERVAEIRIQRALAHEQRRKRKGKGVAHNSVGGVNTMTAHTVGVCGEAAVSLLLGGRMRVVEDHSEGDVLLTSGQAVEVKTTFKGWPFKRWAPAATIRRRYPPMHPMVLVCCDSPPYCLDHALVVGVIGDQWEHIAQETEWGWRVPFSEDAWGRIEVAMQVELRHPERPIGMTGRISDWDGGGYRFLRDERELG